MVAVLADSFQQEKLLINLLDKTTFKPYTEGYCLVELSRRVYTTTCTHVNQTVDGIEV